MDSEIPSSHVPRVLVADDEVAVRTALKRVMEGFGWEVEVAEDGIQAVAMLALDFDLIMVDAEMPNMDGYEVARSVRENPETSAIPIIMFTGLRKDGDRLRALREGINEFIRKPVEMEELQLRTEALLARKRTADALRNQSQHLEETVEKRTAALRKALNEVAEARRQIHGAHLDTIRRLVLIAEYKDDDTAAHVERLGLFSRLLAREVGLSPREVEVVQHAAPMHDVGKIGIPDQVLLKKGRYTEEEWEILKQHTSIGARILSGSPSEILNTGSIIALTHHEHWDGSGYPHELSGEDIPMEGRICAVADVFDALTSPRLYRDRDALPSEEAWKVLQESKGTHLDPELVDLFFENREVVQEIKEAQPSDELPDFAEGKGRGETLLLP